MILGVIPARGGSKSVPKKNSRLLLGKPVIGYTIEAAKDSKFIDRLVVSTEDSDIADVSKSFGVEVIKRPAEFATDTSNIDGALKHAVNFIEKQGQAVDLVVWMQANVPVREPGMIDKVIGELLDSDADSIMRMSSVGWPVEKASKIVNGYIQPYWSKAAKHPRRQDYKQAYVSNGAVYVMQRNSLMRRRKADEPFDYFFGKKRLAYILTKRRDAIEIDEEHDFLLNEMFLERMKKQAGKYD